MRAKTKSRILTSPTQIETLWAQVNRHTGEIAVMTHAAVVQVSVSLGVTDAQAALRDEGSQFDTEHYWYRTWSGATGTYSY